MRWRTQIAVVTLVALGWGAGRYTIVRPAVDSTAIERLNLAALEELVAREPGNAVALRTLTHRYLELQMPARLVVDAVARAPREAQRDGKVSLHVARAHERLGEVEQGSSIANGALNRCTSLPIELAVGVGCDVRTQTELALLAAALDRMIQWHVTPLTDPTRAALAHDIASRPIRMGTGAP